MRVTDEQKHEAFCNALTIIQKRGWSHGMAKGPHGEVCSVRAFGCAIKMLGVKDNSEEYFFTLDSMRRTFALVNKIPVHDVVAWNDAPQREKHEVITAFYAVIAYTAPVVTEQTAHDFVLPA